MTKAATKYDEALRIMRGSNPDRKRVFALLLAASSDGDHRASSAIAIWYYHGQYVRKNFRKAVQFARKAALNGSAKRMKIGHSLFIRRQHYWVKSKRCTKLAECCSTGSERLVTGLLLNSGTLDPELPAITDNRSLRR